MTLCRKKCRNLFFYRKTRCQEIPLVSAQSVPQIFSPAARSLISRETTSFRPWRVCLILISNQTIRGNGLLPQKCGIDIWIVSTLVELWFNYSAPWREMSMSHHLLADETFSRWAPGEERRKHLRREYFPEIKIFCWVDWKLTLARPQNEQVKVPRHLFLYTSVSRAGGRKILVCGRLLGARRNSPGVFLSAGPFWY